MELLSAASPETVVPGHWFPSREPQFPTLVAAVVELRALMLIQAKAVRAAAEPVAPTAPMALTGLAAAAVVAAAPPTRQAATEVTVLS